MTDKRLQQNQELQSIMKEKLAEIGRAFRLAGEIASYEIIKKGNINTTYKVTYTDCDKEKSYVFQKINTYVFKNPVEIMENIDHVTSHIREKYPDRITLHFYHTEDRCNYFYDTKGDFWRIMNFIDSVTFDICDDLSVIRNTGLAFGSFQMQLSDFDGSVLHETIADFHNTRKRLDTLLSHVAEDPMGRASGAADEIAYFREVYADAVKLCDRYSGGDFPVRVTHNDTKSNNVLFDCNTYEPLVVVDLDTVMPGMAMYDFGDAVRFIANTSEEDENDLSKVHFDTRKFRAFCEGYIGQVKDALTSDELDSLVLGAFSITVELASRFLDDYLTGDAYFKTCYPEHNLVRTRCQLTLAKDIMAKYDELNAIVRDVF